MLLTMGLPIFFLELSIGQYTGLGPVEAFARVAPAFRGLGWCTLAVITLVTIYYMVLVGWTLFYTFASFLPRLAWAYCNNEFNSRDCYSGLQDLECQEKNRTTIFYDKTCAAISQVCGGFGYADGGNVTHCFNGSEIRPLRSLYKRVLSSEEYFSNYVLGVRDATWEHFGGMRWELFGCLTLAWIICYFCLIKGVQTVGKIVYFTAIFPYFVLVALLIRGVTLEGASEGAMWFISPRDWSTLLDANVWGDAASQVFYSLGISCGSLVTLSSFSSFSNNCHRDAIFVTLTNLFTSIFAGFVIFSVMGYLAGQMHMPIEEVVQSGTGLAFIAYPEAVVRMPLPNLWAVLFFFMLFILGLGSQFAGVQAINTAILDIRPDLRKHESLVILSICVACWLLGIPMLFDGGVYMYTLLDWNTASWAILLIGFVEVVSVSWFYGCDKFIANIAQMEMSFGPVLKAYWWFSWILVAPLTALGVFGYQMYTYQPAFYGNSYVFPGWANSIGLLIGLSTLAPLPIFFVYAVWKGPIDRSLFRPTKNWAPARKEVLEKSADTSNDGKASATETIYCTEL